MKSKGLLKATLLAAALWCSPSVFAEQHPKTTVTFTVDPQMHCHNCENKIKTNLRFEKGVSDITTDIKDQKVVVEYDPQKTNEEKLEAAFAKIGYTATPVTDESAAE